MKFLIKKMSISFREALIYPAFNDGNFLVAFNCFPFLLMRNAIEHFYRICMYLYIFVLCVCESAFPF